MPAPASKDRRLLLVDGHSMAYRAFHALPEESFATADGQPTNAVYGFTSMLLNVLRDENPTHIAVAFDISRDTFRSREYPEYKATRSASPPSFRGQIELIREVLKALRIPVVTAEDVEADDIIATLATAAEQNGFRVDIVSGDRDSFQLVTDDITVLYPKKGVSELQRTVPALVQEKYGLAPSQYADYAALRGDPSDNLPGVPGVGEKTAAKWLQEYTTLEDLLARRDEVKGKVGEALREHADAVRRNRRLTELVRTVPLPVTVEDLGRQAPDAAAVREIFDLLQFRSLQSRLPDMGGSEGVTHVDASATVPTRSQEALGAWLEAANGAVVAVDVAHDPQGGVTGIALARDGSSWAGAWGDIDAAALAHLRAWFADPGTPKAAHDAKGVMRALGASLGVMSGLVFDSAAAEYVLSPGGGQQPLENVLARHLGQGLPGSDAAQQSLFGDDVDLDSLAAHAAAVMSLLPVMRASLESLHLWELLTSVELPVVGILAQMEETGIAVDEDALRALESHFDGIASEVERQAHAAAGRSFNLASPKQISELLFSDRGLPPYKKTKTGYSTDVEALTHLAATTSDPIPALLLRHRDVTRLRQTVTGLLAAVAADGRIHTTFQQFVAATGRLSSTEPNLQNIPVRTSEGQRIREAFVAGDGFECLLTADYSQIELRIMAHLSGDEELQRAFAAGEDIHTTVACGVFGVTPEEVTADMRRRVKAMSYGLAYGLSPFGLAQQLSIDPRDASELMDTYFARFGKVRDFLADTVERARAVGFTETMAGRRRYLPDLASENRQRREMAERMALNAPIQGTAADIVKIAMIKVATSLIGMRSRLLLQVHDELVLEVAPGELEAVTALVREGMEGAVSLSVPMDINIGLGRSWHEAAH